MLPFVMQLLNSSEAVTSIFKSIGPLNVGILNVGMNNVGVSHSGFRAVRGATATACASAGAPAKPDLLSWGLLTLLVVGLHASVHQYIRSKARGLRASHSQPPAPAQLAAPEQAHPDSFTRSRQGPASAAAPGAAVAAAAHPPSGSRPSHAQGG